MNSGVSNLANRTALKERQLSHKSIVAVKGHPFSLVLSPSSGVLGHSQHMGHPNVQRNVPGLERNSVLKGLALLQKAGVLEFNSQHRAEGITATCNSSSRVFNTLS